MRAFSITSPVFARNSKNADSFIKNLIQIVELDTRADGTGQALLVNGLEVLYRDTINYLITMEKLITGAWRAYYKDKTQNTLSTFYFEKNPGSDIIQKTILSGNQSPIDAITLNITEIDADQRVSPASTSVAQIIGATLESMHGKPYSDKFIDSLRYEGYWGGIYEDMAFTMYKQYSTDVYIGMTAAAAAALSWPVTVVAQVFTLISLGAGIYGIAKDCTGNTYTAKVGYEKMVRVLSNTTYTSGRTVTYNAYVGDISCATSLVRDYRDGDFYDNHSILVRGIENYINFWK